MLGYSKGKNSGNLILLVVYSICLLDILALTMSGRDRGTLPPLKKKKGAETP